MLALHHPRELARLLRTPLAELTSILRAAESYYKELIVLDPAKPGKERVVASPTGKLRRIQSTFYETVLLAKLDRSEFSHGGVPGRNVLTNLRPHLGQQFIFTADISNFYPGIHYKRVERLFATLGCPEDVARMCSRLCTHNYCLDQGLITSPILADTILRDVDRRIGVACKRSDKELSYTRFVDDIAVSGPYDLATSGIPNLIDSILEENGFAVHKRRYGRATDGMTITNLRFHRGHPDIRGAYVTELERQIEDAAALGRGELFQGPYYTEGQIWGRVRFVCWVNPGRGRTLRAKMAQVDWKRVRTESERLGFVAVKKRVVPMSGR